MKRSIVFGCAAVVALAGVGGWRLLAGTSSVSTIMGGPTWQVTYEPDKLTDTKTLTAVTQHPIEGGGNITLKATCDSKTVAFDFEYHAQDQRNDAFVAEGTGQFVHIPYRIDSGKVQEVISKTNYSNTALAVFAFPGSSANQGSGDILIDGMASLMNRNAQGLGAQDLRAFLHAGEVRFELPLSSGVNEIVSLDPRDSSFRDFVTACKIDLQSVDADFEMQRAAELASERAADDRKAADRAKANLEAKQHDDAIRAAAQASVTAAKEACTNGQVTLRVIGGSTLSSPDNQNEIIGRVDYAQIVQTVADPAAVARGFCQISFDRGGEQVRGQVLVGLLEPPERTMLAP